MIGGTVAGATVAGTALGAPVIQSESPDFFLATSEIAQVLLSIGAVSFAVLAARLYGGEIGKAIYTVSGGVILFSTWQLLNGASQLAQIQGPPPRFGSTVNLVVTILLLAGFYMLYETISSATTT
ncbi:hypothetical protein [Halosimplex pelagicum]|uniref:Uncharacterized protein n=1 Tax=Halosimplex pelagicum TaxID=869886 RepID=A0A7D5PF35_9EURY|nr:hypothetical protein [Halosimplex pelagicum]QLH82760.1 hypothetical protein HZS54_14510 [Halosimplex pelagicum]